MDEWKTSFREIYGRSPTADDISIAPSHIKNLLKSVIKENEETSTVKEVKRGLKRKNFEMKMMEDEQFSPVKKRTNRNALGTELRENATTSPKTLEGSSTMMLPIRMLSPKKNQFELDDFSPVKLYTENTSKSVVHCNLTPIKSPTKRPFQREVIKRDFEMLLLPTPDKNEGAAEDYEEFDDEANGDISKALASKPAARRLGGTSTNCQNFQKINLRKKQFVRGKVTAEQKRKMKKKQMFKRKKV